MDYFDSLIFEKMSEQYESLLDNSGSLYDVVLFASGKELKVHKVVLAARSPVFAAMFAHSTTKEAQENRVEIIDVDVEVLELLVRYIYTGKVDTLDFGQYATELLVAADKYQVDSLKSICEQQLLYQISTESVCELLIFADIYQLAKLYNKCIDYFIKNGINQVISTQGWKKLRDKPHLVNKFKRLYLRLSKVNYEKKEKKNQNVIYIHNIPSFDLFNFAHMSYDYESLLERAQLSDVVLLSDGKELCVHKLILSARSPVFAAMFAHHDSTKEAQSKKENRVEIIDIKVEILELLIKYIYTGNIVQRLEWRETAELLVAADKYQLNCLKSICVQQLMSHISIDTVCDIFQFSDAHQITELTTKCLDYTISFNLTRVMASEGWKKNIVVRGDLMAKIYEHLYVEYAQLMNGDDHDKKKVQSKVKEEDNEGIYLTLERKELLSQISAKSVSHLLILADTHQITELYAKCLDYIANDNNITRVVALVGWQKIVARPELFANICQHLNLAIFEQLLLFPITIESVLNLFILADMHRIIELTAKCVEYITDNVTQVMQQEDWKLKIVLRADLVVVLKHLRLKYNREFSGILNQQINSQ